MDSMRGFADEPGPPGLFPGGDSENDWPESDLDDQPLPPLMDADERRMQVRAYNFWAGMLGDSRLPLVGPLLDGQWPDFADHSVLLHFDAGLEDPAIAYVGSALLADCEDHGPLSRLSQVPGRSILSRITDHYMQIVANEAPIGFEAEFANQRGRTILYRGILLPFSSTGTSLDYIYGVINWKELADPATTSELLAEIGLVLGEEAAPQGRGRAARSGPIGRHTAGLVGPDAVARLCRAGRGWRRGQPALGRAGRFAGAMGRWPGARPRSARSVSTARRSVRNRRGRGELDLAEVALEILPALDILPGLPRSIRLPAAPWPKRFTNPSRTAWPTGWPAPAPWLPLPSAARIAPARRSMPRSGAPGTLPWPPKPNRTISRSSWPKRAWRCKRARH
jgi:hypothetical protein